MGVLVVYDKTKPKSFENVPKWLQKVTQYCYDDVEKVILCNKSDVEQEESVSKETADRFSRLCGIPILETSAKINLNIEEAFVTIAQRILYNIFERPPETIEPVLPSGISNTITSFMCCQKVFV